MLLKIIDLGRREAPYKASFRTPSPWSIADLPILDLLLAKCPQMDGQFYEWTAPLRWQCLIKHLSDCFNADTENRTLRP